MCTSLVGFTSALILFWFSDRAYGDVQNHCTRVVTDTCKLRWSHESQEFYVISADKSNKDGGNSQTKAGNRSADGNIWCISNPKRRTVEIQFGFLMAGAVVEFQNCPVNYRDSPLCKSVCVAVDASKETRMINDKALNMNYVRVLLPNEVKAQKKTISNTSTTHEQKTNYPDQPNYNSVTGLPTSSPSQRQPSRRRRSKRRCSKRCRERRLLLKKIANDFLLEFAKQARKLSVSNYSSLTRLLRQNSKLSSQINKLRNYDMHYKRATLTYPPYSKTSRLSYDSIKNDDNGRKYEKRFKRDPGNRHASLSDPYFCGAILYQDGDSNRAESTKRPSKAIDEFSGRWTAPSFPFILSARESNTLLDVAKVVTLDRSVLERLYISIQFSPQVSVARRDADQRMAHTLSTSVNASSLSFISDNMTRPNVNSVTIAATTIGGGFALLFISVVIVILCTRKGKRHWFARSKAQHCECPSISESEHCLSATESVEDKPSVSCSDEQGWGESDKKTVGDNNIITLEVKKSSRERNKARSSSNSSLRNAKSTNKASNRSTCQHAAAIRGSSRHDHCCIVCQIAGKPHKPIMNAQHASQVLTSAERHTQGAVGATSNSKSMNRDRTSNESNGSRNSTSSFPWSVPLPDGEERYRGGRGMGSSLMSEGRTYRVCIRPPPNRTIYSCDPLPFNNNGIVKSPTPPSITPKSRTPLEHLPTGRFPPAYSSDISNGSNNSRTAIRGNNCVCRYMMSHMDDPPPEYSDVVS